MKLSKINIIITSPLTETSYQVLEGELSKLTGVTAPGLDIPSHRLEVPYDPRYISSEQILESVAALGYTWKEESNKDL